MPELTLEDIALRAGVSRSTVSRVINNHPNVSDNVRLRVQDVIEKTGFHPNVAARTLASHRSWTVGLVLPHSVSLFFTDPYYPHLTKGVAQACNQYDYTLALFLVGNEADEKKILPRVSRNSLLDGVLLQSGHRGDLLTDRLLQSRVPLVLLGRSLHLADVNSIDIDNVAAAYQAVRHLVQVGYRRIGTITGPLTSAVGIDRRDGYLKALAEKGIPAEDALIAESDFTEAGGYLSMQALLPAGPDAVFAASDIMASGAMRAARDAGLDIPNDIGFVGFDDLPIGGVHLANPPLTTVRQPIFDMGFQAVEILIGLIENGTSPARRTILNTDLIVRSSCRSREAISGTCS
ncbi:MAG: LacI family DNA-binding transcriptional regulator [Chloroflexota bacterium]